MSTYEVFPDYSGQGVGEPAVHAFAITAADSDIAVATRGLWVGTTGNVKVTMLGGEEVTFTNVQDGTLLPIRVRRVWSTGTTASDFTGLY